MKKVHTKTHKEVHRKNSTRWKNCNIEKVQPKKSATPKKYNRNRVEHKRREKKLNTKKVQPEKSAPQEKRNTKNVEQECKAKKSATWN